MWSTTSPRPWPIPTESKEDLYFSPQIIQVTNLDATVNDSPPKCTQVGIPLDKWQAEAVQRGSVLQPLVEAAFVDGGQFRQVGDLKW